ncbi:hypothetical protein ABZ557_26085 [Streptomyces sp. NPDC019645]|uniref:hypothetical protein n=1 Tax=Streptomyces sp. NPDC019645 TaxID=3154786 RepID=UPI0033E49642
MARAIDGQHLQAPHTRKRTPTVRAPAFTGPGQALRTTTAFGIAALAAFGLTFAAAAQAGYEKVWGLPPTLWQARWRHVVWLGGRIRWRALFPGAVATVMGLLGLRVFSRLVFSPWIASNAVTYGAIGTVLVIQTWQVGVGVVVFGGTLVGRLVHEELPRVTHALKRRG